jgi:endonuclease/exonuclease/phosphatase family metal-dependent hydrolase
MDRRLAGRRVRSRLLGRGGLTLGLWLGCWLPPTSWLAAGNAQREAPTSRWAPRPPAAAETPEALGQRQSRSGGAPPAGISAQPPRDFASAFDSPAACAALQQAARRTRGPRIGSWNLRWFPHGSANARDARRRTDLAWLACAIASLDVDVLAVQEIVRDERGVEAMQALLARLDGHTGGRWRAAFDSCAGRGRQHLGYLYDSRRVELRDVQLAPELNPGASACDLNLRPGFTAYARFQVGPDLHLLTVHLDSGQRPRDFEHRHHSWARLPEVLARLRENGDADLVLLGDFNSMGCSHCVAGYDKQHEIAALDASLRALALRRLPLLSERACTHCYRGAAEVLDHMVGSTQMRELPRDAGVEVHGPCSQAGCRVGRAAQAFDGLSDHCPIVVELLPIDDDRPAGPPMQRP